MSKRTAFINQRIAELTAKGWSERGATKRATKDWRLQSPQHIAAERRNRDLARDVVAYKAERDISAQLMDAAQVAITGHMD